MATRLGSEGNLRRGHGHRANASRSLWYWGRIRLHHGPWFASNEVCRICSSSRPRSSQINLKGGASSALLIHLEKFETETTVSAEFILHNAKIATNGVPSFVEAIAVSGGKIAAVGKDEEILRLRGAHTHVIDGRQRTVIPGLNDSHMHPIRGGLNYNLELRWDGVPSLAAALRRLKEQAARTPPPPWGRVIGGCTAFHFAERRLPTLDEINAV